MAVQWRCLGDVNRALIYKLAVLENATRTMNDELCRFTEKTAKEIEEFLMSPNTTHAQDGARLLKTLDAKCRVIKELMAVFQDLKTAPDLQTLKMQLPYRIHLSPSNFLGFRQNSALIPMGLKFGPLLQNVLLAGSISKALKSNGASAPLRPITLSPESEKEESSAESSPSYGPDVELFNQDESKVNKTENAEFKEHLGTEAEMQRNVADPFFPKGVHLSFPQNVTTYVFEDQIGKGPEVQHQKQTTSQLMHFLKTNGKTKDAREIRLFGALEAAYSVMQRPKSKDEAVARKEEALHTTPKRQSSSEVKVSGPIFKVKKRSAGFVTYSCMIATCSELWDIAEISTEVKTSSCDSVCDENLAFSDRNDSELSDPCSPTVFTSSDRSEISEQTRHPNDSDSRINGSVEGEELFLKIPEFQIKKFEEMPVVASHVVSPSSFYIQNKDAHLKELSEATERIDSKSYAERNCIPDIGSYVMGWFEEQGLWCRGQVTKICGMNQGSSHLCASLGGIHNLEVEVWRIDFGDLACLSLSRVKDLCGQAAQIPIQALRVSLANVKPASGENWTLQAINWFKDKVNNRTLYARLYPDGNTVNVELFMEKGKIGSMRRGASLSLRLAQNGHARHDQMKPVRLKRSHIEEQSRKQSVEWEKYLISCYSQSRK